MADATSDEPEYRGFLTLEIRKTPPQEGAGSFHDQVLTDTFHYYLAAVRNV